MVLETPSWGEKSHRGLSLLPRRLWSVWSNR